MVREERFISVSIFDKRQLKIVHSQSCFGIDTRNSLHTYVQCWTTMCVLLATLFFKLKWALGMDILHAVFMHIYFCWKKRKWKLDRKCMIYFISKLFPVVLLYQTLLRLQSIEIWCIFRAGICAFCFQLLRFLARSSSFESKWYSDLFYFTL